MASRLAFRDLGFTRRMTAALAEALHCRRRGLLLISSPPGGGRSTTLTSLVFDFNPYPRRFPPPDERTGAFSRISIVEDVCDPRGAEVIADRLESGEMVFATMTAESCGDALARLIGEYAMPAEILSRHLRGCLNQRLVRAACPGCGVPVWAGTAVGARFRPLFERLGVAPEDEATAFVHCRGCAQCRDDSKGERVGLFEWMNPVCLDGLESLAPAALRKTLELRRGDFESLHGSGAYIGLESDLREKVMQGRIAIEEAARWMERKFA